MFHKIVTIWVIALLVLDTTFIVLVFLYEPLLEFSQKYMILVMILCIVQIPFIYAVLYYSYISPVQVLNKSIARFYTGLDDEPKLPTNLWSQGMNNVVTFFGKSLQILKVFKEELREGRKLRSEVEIASEIQKQTLSQEEDILPGLTCALGIASAAEVGGDSLDIISGRDGNYYLYVGDVTGHGVASGFVMMMVNALISSFTQSYLNGAEILAATNAILKPRIKQNMMMTCVMLRWDSVHKKMYFTGAGHEFILVYKAKENKVYKIKTGGVALGMMRDISGKLKEQQIAFEENDLIILYTDGITEARYRSEQNGMLFGVDRVIDSIMKLEVRTPEMVFRQLTIDLSAFMGYKHVQYDDITLAVVGTSQEKGQSLTMIDIPSRIDATSITEWNW